MRITKENDGPAVGTVLENPDSYLLCQLGIAEPVDDEAKARHAEWKQRMDLRRKHEVAIAREKLKQERAASKAAEDAKHAEFEALLREAE